MKDMKIDLFLVVECQHAPEWQKIFARIVKAKLSGGNLPLFSTMRPYILELQVTELGMCPLRNDCFFIDLLCRID